MSPALGPWLSAFLFTQAVEVPIYTRALGRFPVSLAARLAIAFGASALTHPIVWFVIPSLHHGSYATLVLRAELFAVLVEGFYLYALGAFDLRRSMLWSLAANGASASLGLACRALFGWP